MSGRLKASVLVGAVLLPVVFSALAGGAGPVAPEIWTIREAVEYALRNNPDSTMAIQRLAAAQADITRGKAAFYPQLDFSSRYSQTDNPMYSFGNILNQGAFSSEIDFNKPGRTDNLNSGVRLSYRFYNGGRDQAGLASAKAREEAAGLVLGAVKNELGFAAVRSFNFIVQAEEIVKVHAATLEEIDALLAVAAARYSEGVLLKADLLNLEVQQLRSQENLIKAENNLKVARKIFLNLMGLKSGKVVIDPEQGANQDLPGDFSYEQRFEILSARALCRAAEARLEQERGGRYPVVEGFAGYEYDRGWETDGSGHSWQAGVQLRYNLFDGHLTSAAEAAAVAMLTEAKEQLRKTELAISLEVKQAELAMEDAETRLLVTDKAVSQAMESARINRARFKEGDILSSEMIAVENRLTDARLRRNVAVTTRRIAIADLRRALGLRQFPQSQAEDSPGGGGSS